MENIYYRYFSISFVLLIFFSDWVIAQGVENGSSQQIVKETEPRLTINGEIEFGFGVAANFDLDDDDKEGEFKLEPSAEFALSYAASKNTLVYLNMQYGRELEIEEEASERTYSSTLEVDEAYIQFDDIYKIDSVIKKTSLKIGRFSFSDKREWYYDKKLDGLVWSFEFEPIDTNFSLSVNREELFGSDLLRHNDFDPVNNFILVAEHEPFQDIRISAYTIVRDDRSDNNDSPRFYGVSSYGKLANKRFKFWTDFGWARGEDDNDNIKGFGLDVGSTMSFGKNVGPYVTLGYAFGSGDGDADTDFRQTDLQGNSDKFGGTTSFKYYGELLDPELSNMHIVTTGIGFRFSATASVDFVLHHYRQDVALNELRGNDLDSKPEGENKDLGKELDIIMGFGLTSNVDTEIVLGYFQPGSAFDEDDDDAYLVEATLTYSF